jgi:hypothetical protein
MRNIMALKLAPGCAVQNRRTWKITPRAASRYEKSALLLVNPHRETLAYDMLWKWMRRFLLGRGGRLIKEESIPSRHPREIGRIGEASGSDTADCGSD